MTKRFFISAILATLLTLILLGTTALLASGALAGPTTSPAAALAAKGNNKSGSPDRTYGTWTDIAPLPTISVDEFYPCNPSPCTPQGINVPARIKRGAGAAYPPNGKVYLFGGRHGLDGSEDFPLRWVFEYNPVTDTWARKNALLDGVDTRDRYVANMASGVLTDTGGTHIYLIGGNSIDSVPTSTVRIYDPIADTITNLTGTDNWPANPVRIPGGSAVYNNKFYVFGGFSALSGGAVYSGTWRYDPMAPSGSRWTQLANLNTPRGYIAGAALNGKLYAIGGDTWDDVNSVLVPTDAVEMLDLAQPSPTWVPVASLPSARGDMKAWSYDTGSGYEIAGKVMVGGGPYPVPDGNTYLYDPVTNSWSSAPGMLHATRNFAAAQLDGFLYAIGGYDYSNNQPNGANFVQRYDASQPAGTPTSTVTGTPPSATPTSTRTRTPTVTPTLCSANYVPVTSTATIVPGTTDSGSHCDDCITVLGLPFPVAIYGQVYNSINLSSNGNAQFTTFDDSYQNECLPSPTLYEYSLAPYWDDLITDDTGLGIFTTVTGVTPNRTLYIEWRATYYNGGGTANFEIVLHEGIGTAIQYIYGQVDQGNTSSTVGLQKDIDTYGQYACEGTGGAVTQGLAITWVQVSCPTVTAGPTSTATNTPTHTPTLIATSTATDIPTQTPVPPTSTDTPVIPSTATDIPTQTPVPPTSTNTPLTPSTATQTPTNKPVPPTATSTSCPLRFTDVANDNTFYANIRCLACRNIINGYNTGCETGNPCFRPGNLVTRGQLAKIVSNSAGFSEPTGAALFEDVLPGTPFYDYVWRLAIREYITGYPCGGAGEPCGSEHLPYFRPSAFITRGQISKIVSNAAHLTADPGSQQFADVAVGSTFYDFIGRLANLGVMSGYPCGGTGEPCGTPALPYFRPAANATRGQASKIVANTFFPDCDTP